MRERGGPTASLSPSCSPFYGFIHPCLTVCSLSLSLSVAPLSVASFVSPAMVIIIIIIVAVGGERERERGCIHPGRSVGRSFLPLRSLSALHFTLVQKNEKYGFGFALRRCPTKAKNDGAFCALGKRGAEFPLSTWLSRSSLPPGGWNLTTVAPMQGVGYMCPKAKSGREERREAIYYNGVPSVVRRVTTIIVIRSFFTIIITRRRRCRRRNRAKPPFTVMAAISFFLFSSEPNQRPFDRSFSVVERGS